MNDQGSFYVLDFDFSKKKNCLWSRKRRRKLAAVTPVVCGGGRVLLARIVRLTTIKYRSRFRYFRRHELPRLFSFQNNRVLFSRAAAATAAAIGEGSKRRRGWEKGNITVMAATRRRVWEGGSEVI